MKTRKVLFAVMTIFASAQCDLVKPGECLGDEGMFGPCVDETCDNGLQCLSTKSGEMCVPSSDLDGDEDMAACAAWRGDGVTCRHDLGICHVSCDVATPDVCAGGTVCDEATEACVYPY